MDKECVFLAQRRDSIRVDYQSEDRQEALGITMPQSVQSRADEVIE